MLRIPWLYIVEVVFTVRTAEAADADDDAALAALLVDEAPEDDPEGITVEP